MIATPSSDNTLPVISNEQPIDMSTTNNSRPLIGAEYSDESGINVSSVRIEVDGVDVTLDATITESGIAYTPTVPLTDGNHTVFLEVRDNSSNSNLATASWTFIVDTSTSDTQSGDQLSDFLSKYWWILLLLIIVIIVFLVLILLMRRKGKTPEATEESEPDTQSLPPTD
jgi:hypothetical protein